jgi:hypothetical protein
MEMADFSGTTRDGAGLINLIVMLSSWLSLSINFNTGLTRRNVTSILQIGQIFLKELQVGHFGQSLEVFGQHKLVSLHVDAARGALLSLDSFRYWCHRQDNKGRRHRDWTTKSVSTSPAAGANSRRKLIRHLSTRDFLPTTCLHCSTCRHSSRITQFHPGWP